MRLGQALTRVLLLLVLSAAIAPVAMAADATVFAAASLKGALDEQTLEFAGLTGFKVIVSFGASNALAKQIEAGAPADLFISADLDWMDYLEQRHLIAANTRIKLLRNTLVLVAPSSTKPKPTLKISPNFGLAAALGQEKLAMANPDSVPAGKYGKRALESLGVWASLEKQVARAENVRAALALVSRGEAPFGIVYWTDALADIGVQVVGAFPPDSYPPIDYPAALLAASKSSIAKSFLDYLHSPTGRAIWEKHGFGMAQ